MTLKDAYDNVIVTLRELIQESKDKGLENEQVFLDFMDELNKLSVCKILFKIVKSMKFYRKFQKDKN